MSLLGFQNYEDIYKKIKDALVNMGFDEEEDDQLVEGILN
jgi:hypothetical protein